MKNTLEKIKGFFVTLGKKITELYHKVVKKETMDKIKDFVVTNKRYLGAAGLFVVLVVVLRCCTGPNRITFGNDDTEQTEEEFVLDEKFEQDTNEELLQLIKDYYTAYANDDLDSLDKIAYPMSNNEKSYIGVLSQYIEKYDGITYYSKSGLTEGSYLVSAYYEVKFYGVDTLAPGMDFFYVETDKDGNLFINNLYSSYNFARAEEEMDNRIYSAIVTYEQKDDINTILADVENKYTEALTKDENLATMINTTLPAAIYQWLNTMIPEDTENTEAVSETTTKKETESQKEEPAAKVTKVKVKENVNVRASASTDSDSVGKANAGETYVKTGSEGDWTQIDYNGSTAYIKAEFLDEFEE